MPLRVLIVPDKFKGTLTAAEAAEAIARGWQRARPDDAIDLLPMSDGGDGFGAVMSRLHGAEERVVATVDAAHRPCRAGWAWRARDRLAIIESARVIGLAMLPRGEFHPFDLDTAGLAAVLRDVTKAGAVSTLIGIGGSATNDGGFGFARELGWHFLDARSAPLEQWTQLDALAQVLPPATPLGIREIVVAVDVQNPLLGPQGCSRIYGPQKGLREADFDHAEKCLAQLAAVVTRHRGVDVASEPGAGAAGGLGFGLRAFAGATLRSGFDLFAEHARLDERLRGADLVVTGEGSLDQSTLMGKGVGEIARRCRAANVPCLGLAGVVPDRMAASQCFTQTHALTPDVTTPDQALAAPAHWLEQLAARVAADWPASKREMT